MLGKIEDEKKYVALSNKIKEAFNERYLNRANGLYGEGRQAEQAMPLYWGLIPEELKSKAAAHLAERVIKDGKHIDVGIFGAKALLNALSDNGYADLAYEVASQKTFPSWGWWIENGATTLYENWNLKECDNVRPQQCAWHTLETCSIPTPLYPNAHAAAQKIDTLHEHGRTLALQFNRRNQARSTAISVCVMVRSLHAGDP